MSICFFNFLLHEMFVCSIKSGKIIIDYSLLHICIAQHIVTSTYATINLKNTL